MTETLAEEKPIEATQPAPPPENRTLTILKGKKTMLFPFAAIDMPLFIKLHREDVNGFMCRFCLKYMTEEEAFKYMDVLLRTYQIHVWTVMTKEQKPRMAGFVYVSNVEKYKCTINGIMDYEFAKGLTRELRRDKYTYSEDAVRTMLNHLFACGMNRIETDVVEQNRRALALDKKIGFSVEGVRRKAMEMDGTFYNVIYMSILREEWKP